MHLYKQEMKKGAIDAHDNHRFEAEFPIGMTVVMASPEEVAPILVNPDDNPEEYQ